MFELAKSTCSVLVASDINRWMQEWDDIALLREYVERDSEESFATLVRRHVDRVYSVALRHTSNPHEAEEITQAVFVILARKARGLRRGVILGGWLYQTTRLTAVTVTRSQVRRARREWEALMQNAANENEAEVWSQITPMLDDALAGLNDTDRNAVVLRFFYGKSMREIGTAMGASEDSVRMRVNRALERLRKYFLKRGVSSTTATIAGAISANSVQAAPIVLAKVATAVALAKGTAASTSTVSLVKGALKIMAWTKAKVAIVSAIVVGLTAYSVLQHQTQIALRDQNEILRKQMAQLQTDNDRLSAKAYEQTSRLAASQIQASALDDASPVGNLPATNLLERFKGRDYPLLTTEQADAFLKANGRRASSLLAAYRTSKDLALLREAMAKYPDDPQVAFEAVTSPWLPAEEKSPWLKTFEKNAPDNALANYLSAIDDFKSGNPEEAMRELAGAAGKRLSDYTQTRVQDDTDVYLSAGYSTAEAEYVSTSSVLLPQLAPLKQLGQQLVDLANSYSQAGDSASAQAVLQMALKMGQTLDSAQSSSPALISQLVGFAVERMALNAMDPNAPIGNGQTVQDELNRIAQTRQTINALDTQSKPLMANLTDQDWVNFTNRRLLFGESAAMQWVISKYGQQ